MTDEEKRATEALFLGGLIQEEAKSRGMTVPEFFQALCLPWTRRRRHVCDIKERELYARAVAKAEQDLFSQPLAYKCNSCPMVFATSDKRNAHSATHGVQDGPT